MPGRVLVLAGGYEFAPFPPEGEAPPPPATMPYLVKAHELMHYDAAILTPMEEAALAAAKAPMPKGFLLADAVKTAVVTVGDTVVGVVTAPPLKADREPPPVAEMNAVIDAAKALRPKVKLLVALIPWGIVAEKQLIDLGAGVFHVVLGSGPGPGFKGIIDDSGHC